MWRYHTNRMDARRSQFDLGRVDAYISRGQQCSCFRTRTTFCRTQSVSNASFSFFDHVIKIGWFFTEIWRYIDFQNGGRLPSWNCFTTIRNHSRSPCCWPQLPVKFHVNLIHRSEDITVWFFLHIWLEMPIQVKKIGVFGNFGPITVIIHHRDSQKAHPCINPRLLSYQL